MPPKGTITRDEPVAPRPPFKNPQLVTPLVDGVLVGGLSLVVIAGLLIVGLVMPSAYDGLKARPDILDELVWIFVITSLIFVHPYFFLVLQLSHALQYLSFPLRVEANRHAGKGKTSILFPVLLYLGMFATGFMVFDLPPVLQMMQFFNIEPYKVASLVAVVVNIHHYFTDGAIWKISNPDVRRELFSHLVTQES